MQNTSKEQNSRRGKWLLVYWLGIMALLLLLVTATYTWFSLSRTPRVSDMYLTVTAPVGLQIALKADAEEEDWGQIIHFEDMVTETSPLRPCTWSEQDGRFYAAIYGADGRLISEWQPLSDELNANKTDGEGYYCVGCLYARSDTDVTVSLGEAKVSEDGTESGGTYLIGTPVWDAQAMVHEDGGQGAQYAVRIGLRVRPVDAQGEPTGDSVFYIYEPNCDLHLEGDPETVDTPNIHGGATLVPKERLFTQSTTTWTEVNPVLRTATIREMGKFLTEERELFRLEAGKLERIDLYIWLEGQDVDCSNLLSEDAQILAGLQFDADYSGQSGLVPIQ